MSSQADSLLPQLRRFQVHALEPESFLATLSQPLLRGWRVALDRAEQRSSPLDAETQAWLGRRLARLAAVPADDEVNAEAAEAEAALRLCWLGAPKRVPESRARSVDFTLGDLAIEVSCPQLHVVERRVMNLEIEEQLRRREDGPGVATSVGYPLTGSARKIANGRVVRDAGNRAREYPANKLIDRLLHSKRDAGQFAQGQQNVLWLDLRHGLGLAISECAPLCSLLAQGMCYSGTVGVWHAFYGEVGASLLRERTPLDYAMPVPAYAQQTTGWFRAERKISAAVVSALDGVLLWESPWSTNPLPEAQRRLLSTLSELRLETSWMGPASTLKLSVKAMLSQIAWLARTGVEMT